MIEYLLADRSRLFTPSVFFLAGVFYSTLSVVLAIVLFPEQASVAHILLATIAVAPLVFKAVSLGADILDRHPRFVLHVQSWLAIIYFSYLLGAIVGLHLSYVLTPDHLRGLLLDEQMRELDIIEGVKVDLSGMFKGTGLFWTIFSNNLRVYIIAILMSFVYGTGGVLLLNWNASIIATFLLRETIRHGSGEALGKALAILPHSILEFLGYFTGGITGILIGVAIIQEGWNRRLLKDVLLLFISGILFIFLGAVIEAGII